MSMQVSPAVCQQTSAKTLRIGCVSYLNAKPLIFGLDEAKDLKLLLDVPSRLLSGLLEDRFDVALLPVIDYQRMPGLRLVLSGGIGCDGHTLTVRIFSRRPVQEIHTLACDTDSHTSIALARIVLAEKYGIQPAMENLLDRQFQPAEARLLIGDKVVCEEPPGFEHQLDLGAAWKEMTGLPFVFAVWMAREGVPLGTLPERLKRSKRQGLEHLAEIVEKHAVPRGWPAGIAMQYLGDYLKYDVGQKQLEAIRLFHQLAAKYQIIEAPRELRIYEGNHQNGVQNGL